MYCSNFRQLLTINYEHSIHNSAQVLQPLIPDRSPSSYVLRPQTLLRPRTHDKRLLDKTTYLNDGEFVSRVLYRDN